jgi:hypothetical protein
LKEKITSYNFSLIRRGIQQALNEELPITIEPSLKEVNQRVVSKLRIEGSEHWIINLRRKKNLKPAKYYFNP